MRVFRDIVGLPSFQNAVVTIGSFDGVHRGHQKILARINQLAREIDGESILVTFHPHPRKIIFPKDNSLSLLSTLDEKLALCEKYGVDNVVVVPFSVDFSRQSPREYIERFLITSFRPSYIVIGYDHRFGLNRAGDIDLLKQYREEAGFEVVEIQKQELEDIAISSSQIRKALWEGDVQHARLFAGQPYVLTGKIIHGDKIGQTIGFPTANVLLDDKDKLIPKDGVYAVNCSISGLPLRGMMYIGRRPTLADNQVHKSIEVHLFDFSDNVYGEGISVELIDFVRGDEKFDSLEALKYQLHKDEEASRTILSMTAEVSTAARDNVCIAILNYNGIEYLESYLPSVLHSASSNINILVIDNASTDDSLEYLKEWHPEVELVELTKNYGFAEGYNQGLRDVTAKYTILLNSDVRVSEHWLDPILALMESDESIGICQPKIRSIEQPTDFEYAGAAGGYIDAWGYPYCRGRMFETLETDSGQYDDVVDIDWASGAAMVVRTELYHTLGGLDGSFFAHMEEIDFCWRVKRAGYAIKVVPSAVVYHLGGGTLDYQSPRKVYLNFRNNFNTLLKNEPLSKLLWLLPLRLILDGVAGLKFLLGGSGSFTLAVLKAHLAVYGGILATWHQRRVDEAAIRKHSRGTAVRRKSPVTSILLAYYLGGKKVYSDLTGSKSSKQ